VWREVRKELGVKQADVAAILDLGGGQSAVSQRETGKTADFSVRELVAFEDEYGLVRGTILRRAGYVVDPQTPGEIVDSWSFLSSEVRTFLRPMILKAWEDAGGERMPAPRPDRPRS